MAKGSHDTYGGWEPRTCCFCGAKIVKTHVRALWFHFDVATAVGLSWHADCRPPWAPLP